MKSSIVVGSFDCLDEDDDDDTCKKRFKSKLGTKSSDGKQRSSTPKGKGIYYF